MSTVIKVENLSKQYRLGEVGTGTISHDLNRWWHRIRGKEDPYLRIGESNDRTSKGNSEYVWALQDINFEVQQGEVLGIIGKNGAGKSTLLKILSKVTAPTTGSIKAKGRIASLLEVGTGFHPELTGRENIYLNGTILGMSKREVSAKLDEIVDFAGVERYLDTPVKRYSSGMMVRLGFAVAAHLEPEILIVDEVLAVGDAEFQKKAVGKMQEVSKEGGRTVLFVSHSISSISKLCKSGLLLANGQVKYLGKIDAVLSEYLAVGDAEKGGELFWSLDETPGDETFSVHSIRLLQKGEIISGDVDMNESLSLEIEYTLKIDFNEITIPLNVLNSRGDIVIHSSDILGLEINQDLKRARGRWKSVGIIPKDLLNYGTYFITIAPDVPNVRVITHLESLISFRVDSISPKLDKYSPEQWRGVVSPQVMSWKISKVQS